MIVASWSAGEDALLDALSFGDVEEFGRVAREESVVHGHPEDLAEVPPEVRQRRVAEVGVGFLVEEILEAAPREGGEGFVPEVFEDVVVDPVFCGCRGARFPRALVPGKDLLSRESRERELDRALCFVDGLDDLSELVLGLGLGHLADRTKRLCSSLPVLPPAREPLHDAAALALRQFPVLCSIAHKYLWFQSTTLLLSARESHSKRDSRRTRTRRPRRTEGSRGVPRTRPRNRWLTCALLHRRTFAVSSSVRSADPSVRGMPVLPLALPFDEIAKECQQLLVRVPPFLVREWPAVLRFDNGDFVAYPLFEIVWGGPKG